MANEYEIISRLYSVYNDRDLEGWLSSFADDSVWTNIPTDQTYKGIEEQKHNYSAWSNPFPNGKCKDLVIRVGEGFAVAEFNGVGIHEGPLETPNGTVQPTGKESSIPFCDVHTIHEGKISTTHRYWDLATAAEQLGL